MELPIGVLAFYGALVIWVGLLAYGLRRKAFNAFLGFGVLLLLYLNVGYFINGAPASIASFIGIYDFLNNFGIGDGAAPAGMATCADNACTVWGDRFTQHTSWGVAFHERFSSGPAWRSNLLYGHIALNSIAFVLMHVQVLRPGTGTLRKAHRLTGRITFAAITLGTLCAVLLAAEHSSVSEYGGIMSTFGFLFMSLCVYGCAVLAVNSARKGNIAVHRRWTIRFIGSMWGAFWIFRVMLFVLDPLLRNWNAAAIQLCIWLSAPIGIAIAEYVRKRSPQILGAASEMQSRNQATLNLRSTGT